MPIEMEKRYNYAVAWAESDRNSCIRTNNAIVRFGVGFVSGRSRVENWFCSLLSVNTLSHRYHRNCVVALLFICVIQYNLFWHSPKNNRLACTVGKLIDNTVRCWNEYASVAEVNTLNINSSGHRLIIAQYVFVITKLWCDSFQVFWKLFWHKLIRFLWNDVLSIDFQVNVNEKKNTHNNN